jgi:hypothetical protein
MKAENILLLILVFVVPVSAVVALCAYGYRWLRRIDKVDAKIVLKLSLWYAGVVTLLQIVDRATNFRLPVVRPFYLVSDVLGLAIGLILVRLYFRKREARTSLEVKGGEYVDLETQIGKIVDSEHFLTALRTTLPKGVDDDKNGLDYVPFLLHNLSERQQKFARRARYSLIATITLGVIFSASVMYFGYILVNEAATGTGKTLAEMRADTQSISQSLALLLPGYYNNSVFQQDVVPQLTAIVNFNPGQPNSQIKASLVDAIDDLKLSGDLPKFQTALRTLKGKVSTNTEEEQKYSAAVTALERFLSQQGGALSRLSGTLTDLTQTLSKAESSLDKPENRTPEIVKRLAIGLAVSTFFVVILRYTSGLYRLNYQQELKTMYDDDAVRRFYVAYKASAANDEQRKAVLTGFITAPTPPGQGPTAPPEGSSLSSEELGVFKEMIAALAKKL